MIIVNIDKDKCIGCGICVKDCSRVCITLEDSKAVVNQTLCNECSHCSAVCPQNAITMPQYDQGEITEYNIDDFSIDPRYLLNFIKTRRSIRQFKKDEVEFKKLDQIIEAGRYSPTASNRQSNRYIILKDKLDEVREVSLKTLFDIAMDPKTDFTGIETYKSSWISMYKSFIEEKIDRLFFNAPIVMVVVSSDPTSFAHVSGNIAAQNMELMSNSLGLGVCYIGFLSKAIEENPKLRQIIEIKENEKFIISMVIGYPDVKYCRTVNRKKADVIIL
jgi:nitroreductase/NAD-dependent dihydropyrimidine dehydrogenase PreA subunit